MPLVSVNPATGEAVAHYPEQTGAQLDLAMGRAHQAFLHWRRRPVTERATTLNRLPPLLRAQAETLANLAALEMGKPVRQGLAEVEKCAVACEQQGAAAPAVLRPEPVATGALHSSIAFEPLGVVLAVMPWNFPFWQVIRAAVPALLAGNAVVLKHASNVTGCALALEGLFTRLDLPEGLFTVLRLDSSRLRPVITHPYVRAITLTGSGAAGRAVAALAGGALRKTVLELGGSDAYVVLADADLTLAARVCAEARLINSGQSCIAAKRFIVVESVRREFEERLATELATARLGDPRLDDTTLGPLARADLREELHHQVTRSLHQGATCLLGGKSPAGPGYFYPPTLLSDVTPGMAVFDEETFGPVAAVTTARDESEALDLANCSTFGLGAAIFTADVARGIDLATRRLEAGNCAINSAVRSDPRLPFGGIKDSGYGRELGTFGLREFVNVKTVCAP